MGPQLTTVQKGEYLAVQLIIFRTALQLILTPEIRNLTDSVTIPTIFSDKKSRKENLSCSSPPLTGVGFAGLIEQSCHLAISFHGPLNHMCPHAEIMKMSSFNYMRIKQWAVYLQKVYMQQNTQWWFPRLQQMLKKM